MIISEKQIMQLISLIEHIINNNRAREIWCSEASILINVIKNQQSEELKEIK